MHVERTRLFATGSGGARSGGSRRAVSQAGGWVGGRGGRAQAQAAQAHCGDDLVIPCPLAVQPHARDVLREVGVVLVLTLAEGEEGLEVLLVTLDVVHHFHSVLGVVVLAVLNLVGQRAEEAVAVAFDLSQKQTVPFQQHGELRELRTIEGTPALPPVLAVAILACLLRPALVFAASLGTLSSFDHAAVGSVPTRRAPREGVTNKSQTREQNFGFMVLCR